MIEKIVLNNECCGCGACNASCPVNAISIGENDRGFLAATVDKNICINCGICDRVCPALNQNVDKMEVHTCAIKLVDSKKLMESQSGGAFYAIAEYVLENDGIVYGVSSDNLKNVCTIRVGTLDELIKLQKSKYVQSESASSFSKVKQDLLDGYKVFYSGTACVIQGLKNYLRYAKVCTDNLLTCDLICHGVPSRKVNRDYINYIEKKNKTRVTDLLYRNKKFGWGSHIGTYILENNNLVSNNDEVIIFSKGYTLSPTCFDCKFTTPYRIADITIGDFWSLERVGLSRKQFQQGLSVCLVRNNEIMKILNCLTEKKMIEYTDIQLEDAMQWNLERASIKPEKYEEFWKMYQKNKFKNIRPVYFALTKKEKLARVIRKLINR